MPFRHVLFFFGGAYKTTDGCEISITHFFVYSLRERVSVCVCFYFTVVCGHSGLLLELTDSPLWPMLGAFARDPVTFKRAFRGIFVVGCVANLLFCWAITFYQHTFYFINLSSGRIKRDFNAPYVNGSLAVGYAIESISCKVCDRGMFSKGIELHSDFHSSIHYDLNHKITVTAGHIHDHFYGCFRAPLGMLFKVRIFFNHVILSPKNDDLNCC